MAEAPADTEDNREKTVLVVGATGNQGGVIIDHLLADDRKFAVCGLTRTPDSDGAKALAERGVDIRRGDLNDKTTLRPAIDGVDAVVIVTNIWIAGFEESEETTESNAGPRQGDDATLTQTSRI